MSVSPGRRKSPGFCHIRRQGNRLAQKQIICPIYRGSEGLEPYRMGPKPEILAGTTPPNPAQTLRSQSFLEGTESGGVAGRFRTPRRGSRYRPCAIARKTASIARETRSIRPPERAK